ncbi:MAG: hypothetical protein GEU80_11495 [Dehalococcoidia bacterium]|nr:hypothetical protein [Dehalococcoidia bacterium]
MVDAAALPGALSDVRVLDLSTRLSGAFCARLFGDHGADVVLLETPDGHALRGESPFLDGIAGAERSLVHAYANQNKRSVVLEPGDARRRDLVFGADVIVVSDRATAEEVRKHAGAGAVIVATTPYGLDTSMADMPGNDLTAGAASGWALTNGDEDEPPLRPTLHQSAYLAGTMAYTGAVAALVERESSGLGQTVDVCELEPMLWMAAPGILGATQGNVFGAGRGRPGVFTGPVATKDGYFSVTFSRPHFWTEAMRALGLDDLASDPRYLDRTVRQAEAEPLAARIEGALAERDRWDLFHDMSRRRCTVGIVLDMSDLAESEHLAARWTTAQTQVDERPAATLSSPCQMTATPWTMRSPAPRLGEHTDAVLTEWSATREGARG